MVFRFAGDKYHATYKSHIPIVDIERLLNKMPPIKMLSIVHEVGDDDEDNPTPYEHTHVFAWHKHRLDTRDQRYWDIDDIHPHIAANRGLNWAKNIVTKYHKGHKTKANGKKYYIEPVMLHQVGVEEWKMIDDMYKLVVEAPTLAEAGKVLDIEPKSLSDVKLLRTEANVRGLESNSVNFDRWRVPRFAAPLSLFLVQPVGSYRSGYVL